MGVSSQRTADGRPIAALCDSTPTGQLIDLIVSLCPREVAHRKFNFVNRVLQDGAGRLRPPTTDELAESLPRILRMMRKNRKDIFVFLGNHIRVCLREAFPESRLEYYQVQTLGGAANALFVHHPSYIRVYRHKHMDEYARKVARLIAETAL